MQLYYTHQPGYVETSVETDSATFLATSTAVIRGIRSQCQPLTAGMSRNHMQALAEYCNFGDHDSLNASVWLHDG